MKRHNALQLRGVGKTFDGFQALQQADFLVRWGEVHALLGENGAGKSTLMNIAAGLYAPETGELLVDDNPVRLRGPADAARLRIGMVHQHFKLVRPFSVAENVLLGLPAGAGSHRRRLAEISERIREQAAALGFAIRPEQRVAELSIAEQQRVEILKVLLAGARILILDEPTAVLTDGEGERLLQTLRALAAEGAAVVLVTHRMQDALTYADRLTVMRGGRTLRSLDPAEVNVNELVRLTVGDAQPLADTPRSTAGAPLLTVRGLRTPERGGRRALDGIDLQLRAGEIYGIAGVGGNGQGELADVLMGLPQPYEGEVRLEGFGDLAATTSAGRRDLRIAAIPADRYGSALAGSLSVADNFAIGAVHSGRFGGFARLDRRAQEAATQAAVAQFDVQGVRSVRQKAALLSGGNAQKLVIAREFGREPRLVLAHSPSRGLDVRAGAEVQARLLAAREAGAAVLLISEDLDEVLALADRIGVMSAGRLVAEFQRPADRQAIGHAMVNHA